MKRFGLMTALCVLLTWAAALVGCKTISTTMNPARVYAMTEFAAYNTATQLIRDDSTRLPEIASARDGFCQLAGAETWNIRRAAEIALENGLYAFVSEDGDILIQGGLLLVDLFGPVIDLSTSDHARAFILASCSGLQKAVERSSVRTGLASRANSQDSVYQELAQRTKATRPRLK